MGRRSSRRGHTPSRSTTGPTRATSTGSSGPFRGQQPSSGCSTARTGRHYRRSNPAVRVSERNYAGHSISIWRFPGNDGQLEGHDATFAIRHGISYFVSIHGHTHDDGDVAMLLAILARPIDHSGCRRARPALRTRRAPQAHTAGPALRGTWENVPGRSQRRCRRMRRLSRRTTAQPCLEFGHYGGRLGSDLP